MTNDRLGPPGCGPDGAPRTEFGKNNILRVLQDSVEAGIPLPNWPAVQVAFKTYVDLMTVGGPKAPDKRIRLHGPLPFLSQTASRIHRPTPLDITLRGAKLVLKENDVWKKFFDYDQSSYHFGGSTFTIAKLPPDEPANYLLGIYNPEEGSFLEQKLAQRLELERATIQDSVHVAFAPEGNNFSINMDMVADRLSRFFGADERRDTIDGEQIASSFMMQQRVRDNLHPYQIGFKDGFRIECNFGSSNTPQERASWQRNGNTISGPLSLIGNVFASDPFIPTSLVFTVTDARNDNFTDRIRPVIKEENKKKMRNVSTGIAQAFKL